MFHVDLKLCKCCMSLLLIFANVKFKERLSYMLLHVSLPCHASLIPMLYVQFKDRHQWCAATLVKR